MKALIIIDMQVGNLPPLAERYNADSVIKNINLLSEYFRKSKDLIIHVQHDGSMANCFYPESPEWQVSPDIKISSTDLFVNKTATSSFYKTNLQQILDNSNISDIYIVGCATDFCVDTTVRSALEKEYNVHIVSDAHSTGDKLNFKAPDIINYYNWLWENLSPTKYKIKVITTANIINNIE